MDDPGMLEMPHPIFVSLMHIPFRFFFFNLDIDSPIQPSAPAAGNEPGPDQVGMLSDMETSDVLAPSGLKGLSPSFSFEKLDLVKLDLNSLVANMKKSCKIFFWKIVWILQSENCDHGPGRFLSF